MIMSNRKVNASYEQFTMFTTLYMFREQSSLYQIDRTLKLNIRY